jgi:DNA polymerase-1
MTEYEYIDTPKALSQLINEMSLDGGACGVDIETASNLPCPQEPRYADFNLSVQRVLKVEYQQLKKQWLKTLLNPFQARPRLLSLNGNPGENIPRIIDLDRTGWSEELQHYLETHELIGQNLHFDLKFLRVHYGLTPWKIWDSLIAAALLKNGQEIKYDYEEGRWYKPTGIPYYFGIGLHEIVRHVLGIDLPKEYGESNWGAPELSPNQLKYAADDVRYMPQIKNIIQVQLEEVGLAEVHRLECDLVLPTIDLELAGINVDAGKIRRALGRARKRHERVINILLPKLHCDDAKVLNNGPALTKTLNCLGVPVEKTDEDELARHKHPLVKAVMTYKKCLNKHLKPLEAYEAAIGIDSRIHADFLALGTETGRFSCRHPNVQQVPHNWILRSSFTAPAGRALIKADYNQIELRAIADLVPERRMQQAFREGTDLHALTAAHITNKTISEVTGAERYRAKPVNFGFSYGQRPLGFVTYALVNYRLEFSLEEAVEFQQRFFDLYSDIQNWHAEADFESRCSGELEVRTIYGRRRIIPMELSQWDKYAQLINGRIQGSCADLLKAAMIDLHRVLPPDTLMVNSIHDELVFETEQEVAQERAALIKERMEQMGQAFFASVPVLAEVKVISNWGGK